MVVVSVSAKSAAASNLQSRIVNKILAYLYVGCEYSLVSGTASVSTRCGVLYIYTATESNSGSDLWASERAPKAL